MNKKKLVKILVWILVPIVIITGAFFIYVGDYYHADEYTPELQVKVEERNGYTIYGESSQYGFIFYQGGKVEEESYEPLMYQIARRGITCVLVDMPFNLAIFGINMADKVIEEVDVKHWYIGGHSLGGAMACSYVKNNPEKIEGVVLLGSYASSPIDESVKAVSIVGTNDLIFNQEKYVEGKQYFSNYEEVIIDGGNHSGFGNYGEQDGDGIATITKEEQWKITSDTIVWFIKG